MSCLAGPAGEPARTIDATQGKRTTVSNNSMGHGKSVFVCALSHTPQTQPQSHNLHETHKKRVEQVVHAEHWSVRIKQGGAGQGLEQTSR